MAAEESNLREGREPVSRSRARIAEALGVGPAAVSRPERRADMDLSALRKLVRAMGGEPDVVARFPGRPPARIVQFGGPEVGPGRWGRKKKSAGTSDGGS